MSKVHGFLLEHANFPFPHRDEEISVGITDMSIEVRLLESEWKANHAMRDDTVVQKLRDTRECPWGHPSSSGH